MSLLRLELELLYAQRAALDATIRELESKQIPKTLTDLAVASDNSLEFDAKPCNLTSCRNA